GRRGTRELLRPDAAAAGHPHPPPSVAGAGPHPDAAAASASQRQPMGTIPPPLANPTAAAIYRRKPRGGRQHAKGKSRGRQHGALRAATRGRRGAGPVVADRLASATAPALLGLDAAAGGGGGPARRGRGRAGAG